MAEVRFATGWRRFVPFIGYHHILMLFIAIAIVLLGKSKAPKSQLQLNTASGFPHSNKAT